MYLGAKLWPMKLEKGVWAWVLSPSQYVQEICWNVQKYVKENLGVRWKLPKQTPNPFTMGYAPELYASPMLDP